MVYKVIVKNGNDLSFKERKEMHKIEHDTFDPTSKYTPLDSDDKLNDIYFILKYKRKLLSFAILERVYVRFRAKKYMLAGIGDMISVVRGKGYGKQIMTAMRKYAKAKKWTVVGFCGRHNTEFYVNCAYKIAKNEVIRFIHKKKYGTLEKNTWDKDVVYITGRNNFMKEFLAHKKDIVWVPYHW